MNVTLVFDNKTSQQKHVMLVELEAVPFILEWYGAFYSGDDYTALVNGIAVAIDKNGERDCGIVDVIL